MLKKYKKYLLLGLCLANLLVFLIFYITRYLPSVRLLELPDAVNYVFSYLSGLIDFLIAPLTAVTLFAMHSEGVKDTLITSLLLSLPRTVYLLPYYYLYENALGNDSLESTGLSLIITVGGIAVLCLRILLLVFVLKLVSSFIIGRRLCKETPYLGGKKKRGELKKEIGARLQEELPKKGFTDLSLPVVAAVFSVSLLEFLYPLIREIVSVVGFFTEYSSYTPLEIFSITFAFIFLLIELVAAHTLGILLKDIALKMKNK